VLIEAVEDDMDNAPVDSDDIPGVKSHYLEDDIRQSQTMDTVTLLASL